MNESGPKPEKNPHKLIERIEYLKQTIEPTGAVSDEIDDLQRLQQALMANEIDVDRAEEKIEDILNRQEYH